jgi:cysteine desulfurase
MTIVAYLDNNATTRAHPDVLGAMRYYEETMFLNASSVAGELLGASRPLHEARTAMLDLMGGSAEFDQIILTSGASEANGWVISRILEAGSHAVTCATEHSSILASVRSGRRRGRHIDVLPVDSRGLVEVDKLAAALRPETRLVSIQLANNETGVIQPLATLVEVIRERAPSALVHTDATQALGRIPVDLANDLAEIDLLSFSAHKFHGPKGIGGLFLRDRLVIDALIPGEQERGLRGGTSNVPGAAGLASAARLAKRRLELMPEIADLRDRLEDKVAALRPDAMVNGRAAERLPNTSSICIPGIAAEAVVEQLALHGICIATGSACNAGANAPSAVLTAMGVSAEHAYATLRFSLSAETTREEVDVAVAALADIPGFMERRLEV